MKVLYSRMARPTSPINMRIGPPCLIWQTALAERGLPVGNGQVNAVHYWTVLGA